MVTNLLYNIISLLLFRILSLKNIEQKDYVPGASQTVSSSSDTREDSELLRTNSNYSDEVSQYHRPKRPRIDIVSDNVALALDRTKTSDRSATHILAAASTSLGHDLDEVNLSHSTVRRAPRKVRETMAAQLKKSLRLANHLTVHWDGKLLPEMNNSRKKVDRLPVVVSGLGCDQLLGVPKVEHGTAVNHASSIMETNGTLQDASKQCVSTRPMSTQVRYER